MNKRAAVVSVLVLSLLTTTLVASAYMEGLQTYWPFDEGGGVTAFDAEDGYDGTVHGATYSGDAAPTSGNEFALSFDGIDDYVQIPNGPALEPSEITVSAWVKGTNPGGTIYILAKGSYECRAASYAFYTWMNNGLRFYIRNVSYVLSPNGIGVWNGEWRHIVGTYDGAFVRLYLDGQEVENGVPNTLGIGYGLPTSNDLYIGTYMGTCSFSTYFPGMIDEVRIWDRALSADEVLDLYQGKVMIEIDIKPGTYPNSINLRSRGLVPVAVLTTDSFDATTTDPVTVLFADASPLRWVQDDVDNDGDVDLVFHFVTQELSLDENSTEATLAGETFDGTPIEGLDSVVIVP